MNPGDNARYAVAGGLWGSGVFRKMCSGITSDGHVVDFWLLDITSEEGFSVCSATDPETGWQIASSTLARPSTVAKKAREIIGRHTYAVWKTKLEWAMERNKEAGR